MNVTIVREKKNFTLVLSHFFPIFHMPTEEAVAHPTDVSGVAWVPPSGEPQGESNIAAALGLEKHFKDVGEGSEATGEKPKGEDSTTPSLEGTGLKPKTTKSAQTQPKAGEVPLVDQYSAAIQRDAEEAYAWSLNRARSDETYLDKLVQSKDPIDQRLATKLLARNDFGSKTVDEYKRNLIVKNAGKDPRDQALAQMRVELDELRNGTQSKDWSSWKAENAVSGEAEVLADNIRAEYPSMNNADVLAFVRGKLGITQNPTQKERMGFVRGGLGAVPEEDAPNLESPLAKALLPKDIKKTVEFGRQLLGRRR